MAEAPGKPVSANQGSQMRPALRRTSAAAPVRARETAVAAPDRVCPTPKPPRASATP